MNAEVGLFAEDKYSEIFDCLPLIVILVFSHKVEYNQGEFSSRILFLLTGSWRRSEVIWSEGGPSGFYFMLISSR